MSEIENWEEKIKSVISDFRSSTHCIDGDEDMCCSLYELLSKDDLATLEDEMLGAVEDLLQQAREEMHAEIKKEYDDCLWLHIHRGNGEGSSYPLLGDEIEAIRDACNEYLLESESEGKDENKKTNRRRKR